MNWNQIAQVAQIIKKITPIIFKIVEMVNEAKNPQSQGGTRITKDERQKIIIEAISDIPVVVAEAIKTL